MITAMPRIAIAAHDFGAMLETFRDKLGMPVVDISARTVDSLGARLAMCTPDGGSNIELMSPADPAAPLSQSLERFLERRGEGLFALMLEAPDPNAEAEQLLERGLNVLPLMAGAGGRDVHPNSTHGVLIRVYPVDSFAAPSPEATNTAGLSGIVRVLIAVRDLDEAATIYGQRLALEADNVTIDEQRGTRSLTCRPPAGGLIELIAIEDPSRPFADRIGQFLEDRGEGMYALVLETRDLEKTTGTLAGRGIDCSRFDDPTPVVEIDPASTFGARLLVASG